MKNNTLSLTKGAVIAAMYVALTLLSHQMGLASGVIQLRLSEALMVLAIFTPAAIPGLTLGCLLSNLLTGGIIWDVIFGSIATLLGTVGTRLLRKWPYVALLPPILSNVIIVSLVLKFAYGLEGTIPYFMLTVGIGEFVCCGILGALLLPVLKRYKNLF